MAPHLWAGKCMTPAGRACSPVRVLSPSQCVEGPIMIVTITTFRLPQPTTLTEITKTFEATAPKYRDVPGLLRKHYFMSEDGQRAGGIYLWQSRADAERLYTPAWKAFVEEKYGGPPSIEYLHSPVTVDNTAGKIEVAA